MAESSLDMVVNMTVNYDGLTMHDLDLMDHDDKILIEQVYVQKNNHAHLNIEPFVDEINEWLEALQRRPDYHSHRIRKLNNDSVIIVYTVTKAKVLLPETELVERSTRSVDV